ncbi:2-polyprenyl-6-methoxyphenol hydroxylase-like FAD-dependent oxidoreductase [Comamonas sp. BIGb0152]|uniref:FAD-dependent monooxygenase n=1 Tax=Comamonas sp. BIGb0152 TaxID=2940601 RepID=UPI00216AB198|nr:FAD-dependent monooxygenase [Comamonas sp. BIGb0152]MCS4294995.1 2-polyprenyl-6-methoxyphenol hydroxylase-like FAD-dependent oxidoreductase [Comamonas sp. BIGb0152]
MPTIPHYDVIIVGAGPVGLLLSCELRLAHCSVLVLEQASDPHSPLKQAPFGIRGLNIPSLEALQRRGLLDAVTAPSHSAPSASRPHWMQQARQPGGHFAGMPFFQDQIDTARWPYRLPSPASESMPTTMERLESVLAQRAAELGVEVRRGVRVTDVVQSPDGVQVQAGDAQLQSRWLVGCDGGRSPVRKAAGFEFAGTEPEFSGYSVEAELENSAALTPGRHYTATGMYTFQPPGTIAMVDFDGGAFHGSSPITAEHVQTVLRRVSGTDTRIQSLRIATTWTDRARQATRYRKGRVLLAGDAAHIHSPLGGQGLNLGIGDAMNLGWKLAATLRGDAPEGLLDSYTAERHPVGAQVLDWSRAQVALMRPSPATRALAHIVRALVDTRDGATYFADRVWGATLRYDLGDPHPLVGRSAPDFALTDGSTLASHLQTGCGLLLDFDNTAALRGLAMRWTDRLRYIASSASDELGLKSLLIRPDGIVAWVGDGVAPYQHISQAIQRWFGPAQ